MVVETAVEDCRAWLLLGLSRNTNVNQPMISELKTFASTKQRRLDQLLDKNADGTITPVEKSNLESLVAEAEQVMVSNARVVAEFARSQSPQPPIAAVPVTVWVTPQPVEP